MVQHHIPCLQEQEFTSKQAQSLDQELKRILDEQKEERKLLELRFLDAQQDLKRSEFIHERLCGGHSSPMELMIHLKLTIEQAILA